MKYSHLICIHCANSLSWTIEAGACNQCGKSYPLREMIPVFTAQQDYWCNISSEKMLTLIAEAEKTQDWVSSVKKHIPEYANAIIPFFRADAQFLFPINKNSIVLDAGSMWGGLTIPIAQFCKKIYAVDTTWQTLRLLSVRAKQMGFDNVETIVSNISKLPFPNNYFDFIVVNGVLEWLGMNEQTVLEQHWKGKYSELKKYDQTPYEMQLNALRELYRVLKPGGGIYVAIENRIGLQYFLGHPDDHMNVRFVPFLPRRLANYITKKIKGIDYRTYIYTPTQLTKLLAMARFRVEQEYSVFPHYGKISRATPFDIFPAFKKNTTKGATSLRAKLLGTIWNFLPAKIGKYFSPSLAMVASKDAFAAPARLLFLLSKHVKNFDATKYYLIIQNNRFANENTTNYLVFNKLNNQVEYFCKLGRTKSDVVLQRESLFLKNLNEQFVNTPLENTTPNLIALINDDGLIVQVTNYIAGNPLHNTFLNRCRNLCKISTNKKWTSFSNHALSIIRLIWLRSIDRNMLKAVKWLADFHKITTVKDFDLNSEKEKLLTGLENNGFLTPTVRAKVAEMIVILQDFKNLFFCIEHGDYDICNVLISKNKKICILDFEHSEAKALPFFDLGNLIFSPFLTEWKLYGGSKSLKEYAENSGWASYFITWISEYASRTNIPLDILRYLPLFACISQNAKTYPIGRDPYSYPMYGKDVLHKMLNWIL